MTRLFWDEWRQLSAGIPKSIAKPRRIIMITGKSGEKLMAPIVSDLEKVRGLQVELIGAENTFFGDSVTVSGLLTGSAVIDALKNRKDLPCLLLPGNMLKFGDDLFLDSTTPQDIRAKLGTQVLMVEPDAESLYRTIFCQGEDQ